MFYLFLYLHTLTMKTFSFKKKPTIYKNLQIFLECIEHDIRDLESK